MDRDARTLAFALLALVLVDFALFPALAQSTRVGSGRLQVRWLGQDGHDFVGPNNRLEPSDVQDVHLRIDGLDPGRKVVFIDLTGEGGDQWHFNRQSFSWKAVFQREDGSQIGDLFIEPGRVETGRSFHILIRYDDGLSVESDFRGLTASPRTRMPNAELSARWVGQDGSDWTSPGPSVGPDGLQDVRLAISGVSAKVAVRSLGIVDERGTRWESGVNPDAHHNAELVLDPKDPSRGSLFFSPTRSLEGERLRLTVTYVNETIDGCEASASACDPMLAVAPSPLPRIVDAPFTLAWIGQEDDSPGGRGAVHLRLGGLNGLKPIVGVVLTDSVQGSWVHRADRPDGRAFHVDDFSEPLVFRPSPDSGDSADLYFAPYRDEAGAGLTLRLIFDDGGMAIARLKGGSCDPGKRFPKPEESRVEAKPGDDLQALADRGGLVVLSPGTYRLMKPLVLGKPVTITSEGGATLLFAQGAGEPPWSAAIKVHCGHTSLDRFKVRFEGPIRWRDGISYGPAVIGTTDNFDNGHAERKVQLRFTRLDLEIPPVTNPSEWTEALRLMSLRNTKGGYIAGNTLCGGPIEFFDGPWRIEKNRSRGTPPGTVSAAVFAGHFTHDLIVRGNWAEPLGPYGKVWRFLVLTSRGSGDLVADNTIKRIGPRDDDTIPWANAPEMFLTESYQLTYEGKIMGLSEDGRLLRIGRPQGYPARSGGAVALLTGPAAGAWRKIAQVVDASTYLVDEPIPPDTGYVSIASGFVGETFENNTIDTRGGKRSAHFVFAGNHFGTRFVGNTMIGTDDAFRLTACPTEAPRIWGWSHAPVFGLTVAENILDDCARGGAIGVEHDKPYIKTNRGRVYMSARVDRNIVRWSDAFVAKIARSGVKEIPVGLTIGFPPSLDPDELKVQATGNRVEVPDGASFAPILSIPAAEFNGRRIVDGKFRFAGDPTLGRGAGGRPNEPSR